MGLLAAKSQNELDGPSNNRIHQKEEDRCDRDHDENHDRGHNPLIAGRPSHFANFVLDLANEAKRACPLLLRLTFLGYVLGHLVLRPVLHIYWQEWRDSNPRHPVLETGALPAELHSFGRLLLVLRTSLQINVRFGRLSYSMMPATTPAPTVRPPSRMAKRSFSSIAIGTISSTSISQLSPGITISVPEGKLTTPVTSVVLK